MSKGKKIIIIIAICDILAACAVAAVFYIHSNSQLELRSNKMTVEYGESISLDAKDYLKKSVDKDIVKETKVTYRSNPEEGKKYDKLGRYIVKLKYKKETARVKVMVEDTIKPEFNGINSFESIKGVDVSWGNYIKATDLSEVDLKVDDSGVNINKTGEYTLTAVARDTSGNEKEKEIKVIVKERPDNMTGHAVDVDENTGIVTVTAIVEENGGTDRNANQSNRSNRTNRRPGSSGSSNSSSSGSSGSGSSSDTPIQTEPTAPAEEPTEGTPSESEDSGDNT